MRRCFAPGARGNLGAGQACSVAASMGIMSEVKRVKSTLSEEASERKRESD